MDKDIALARMLLYLCAPNTQEQADKYTDFVSASMSELSLMLDWDKVTEQDCTRLSHAAGANAFYIYILSQLCSEPRQLRALDITIDNGGEARLKYAIQIREDSLMLISDLLISSSFYFGGVC